MGGLHTAYSSTGLNHQEKARNSGERREETAEGTLGKEQVPREGLQGQVLSKQVIVPSLGATRFTVRADTAVQISHQGDGCRCRVWSSRGKGGSSLGKHPTALEQEEVLLA